VKLVGICGSAFHGKDSVANVLVKRMGFVKVAFADKLKALALAIDPYVEVSIPLDNYPTVRMVIKYVRLSELVANVGWDEAKKNPDVRRLLQRIGTEGGRNTIDVNIWTDLHYKEAQNHDQVAVPDYRFPNEAQYLIHHNAFLIRVHDPRKVDNGVGTSHSSEQFVDQLPAHVYILNDGTLEDLEQKVEQIIPAINAHFERIQEES